jgi:hypothetical protein
MIFMSAKVPSKVKHATPRRNFPLSCTKFYSFRGRPEPENRVYFSTVIPKIRDFLWCKKRHAFQALPNEVLLLSKKVKNLFRGPVSYFAFFAFSLLRARRSSPPIGRRSCERTRSVTSTRGRSHRQSARQPRRGTLAGKRRRRGVARGAPCRKVESQG